MFNLLQVINRVNNNSNNKKNKEKRIKKIGRYISLILNSCINNKFTYQTKIKKKLFTEIYFPIPTKQYEQKFLKKLL